MATTNKKTAGKSKSITDKEQVELYMKKLEHPFKKEVEALRKIILKANKKLAERIKWNAPSYYYGVDMAAFNLHQEAFVQLIFVFHNGAMIKESDGLLEGNWKDRRQAKFYDMKDVKAKTPALRKVVNEWIALHS